MPTGLTEPRHQAGRPAFLHRAKFVECNQEGKNVRFWKRNSRQRLRIKVYEVTAEECLRAKLREPADIDQLTLASELVKVREQVEGIVRKTIDPFVAVATEGEKHFLLSELCQAVRDVGPARHGLAAASDFVSVDPGDQLAWNEVDASEEP